MNLNQYYHLTSCPRARVVVAQSLPAPVLPAPSHSFPSYPIRSRPVPSRPTSFRFVEAISEEVSEIVGGSTVSQPDIDSTPSQIATHHITRNNTPIHNILSTAPQFSISQKAL
jgi:hypothetical protein